jgi:hypothetical protein
VGHAIVPATGSTVFDKGVGDQQAPVRADATLITPPEIVSRAVWL